MPLAAGKEMPDQVGHDVKWEELTSVFGVNNLIYKGVSQTVIPL